MCSPLPPPAPTDFVAASAVRNPVRLLRGFFSLPHVVFCRAWPYPPTAHNVCTIVHTFCFGAVVGDFGRYHLTQNIET